MPAQLLTYPAELLRCLAEMPYTQANCLVETEHLRRVHGYISSPLDCTEKQETNSLSTKTDLIRGVRNVKAFNTGYSGSMLIFHYYALQYVLYWLNEAPTASVGAAQNFVYESSWFCKLASNGATINGNPLMQA
jgi:hypothetical protein